MKLRALLALLAVCGTVGLTETLFAQQRRPPPRTARPDTTRRPPARPDTTRRTPPRPPPRPAAQRQQAPPPPRNEQTFAAAGGLAQAGLGFGLGPTVGFVARYRRGTWPIALRADGLFGRYSQTPTLNGTPLADNATLNHFGVGTGIEYPLGEPRASAPYVVATAGVYRFAGSGPAGDEGDVDNGVFTATTDVAVGLGAGMRFMRRFFIEARVLTVGDFTSFPLTIGYRFK